MREMCSHSQDKDTENQGFPYWPDVAPYNFNTKNEKIYNSHYLRLISLPYTYKVLRTGVILLRSFAIIMDNTNWDSVAHIKGLCILNGVDYTELTTHVYMYRFFPHSKGLPEYTMWYETRVLVKKGDTLTVPPPDLSFHFFPLKK